MRIDARITVQQFGHVLAGFQPGQQPAERLFYQGVRNTIVYELERAANSKQGASKELLHVALRPDAYCVGCEDDQPHITLDIVLDHAGGELRATSTQQRACWAIRDAIIKMIADTGRDTVLVTLSVSESCSSATR